MNKEVGGQQALQCLLQGKETESIAVAGGSCQTPSPQSGGLGLTRIQWKVGARSDLALVFMISVSSTGAERETIFSGSLSNNGMCCVAYNTEFSFSIKIQVLESNTFYFF